MGGAICPYPQVEVDQSVKSPVFWASLQRRVLQHDQRRSCRLTEGIVHGSMSIHKPWVRDDLRRKVRQAVGWRLHEKLAWKAVASRCLSSPGR